MLKRRIIPVQLLLDGRLVKTIRFDEPRDVGSPVSSTRVYNDQSADELIFLNISRTDASVEALIALIEQVSEVCFVPLTMGGGIRSTEDAARLIRAGADKVSFNTVCYGQPEIMRATAEIFGTQAVVAAIDVRRTKHGWQLYSACGRQPEQVTLEDHIRSCVDHGAGEILIQSIDRDGTMDGYDVELLRAANTAASVPVVALGGSGNYAHLEQAFVEADVSAVACGSLFNFSDSNPVRARAYLLNHDIPMKVV